jgi:archaeal chaperonin
MEEAISKDNERVLGKDAQRTNILAARVISETVKTTLGPCGMDKMLVDRAGRVIITNDGATILDEMEIEHPAAKMIVEIAKTQEEEVGDGTTTSVMLAGKLLENAERLLDKKIHPTVISKGYRLAANKALELLKELSFEITDEEDLIKITNTAMTGKGVEYVREVLSKIIVDAVKIVADGRKLDPENIRIQKKKGPEIKKSSLIKGIVLDNGKVNVHMPQRIENARIALVEDSLEIRTPETEARISVSSPEQLQQFISHEDKTLKEKVEKLEKLGANVLICQRGIDDAIQFYLANAGIYAIRRVPKSDMASIAKVTNGKIVSKIEKMVEEDLGKSGVVEEIKEGEDNMTYITDCEKPGVVTIMVNGGTEHLLDEVERALRDAIGDLSSILGGSRVVAGGGAIEMELNKKIFEYSNTLGGREKLAVEEFANALEFIPVTLAENAGLDPIDVLTELKTSHSSGNQNFGLNLFTNKIEDNWAGGIIEPSKIKEQAISSATEVAIMVLRIDDIIAARSNPNSGVNSSNFNGNYD